MASLSSKISLVEINKNISSSMFLLLFVGYILYNVLLLYKFIPPFLGGYFGIVSTVAFVLLAITSKTTIKYSFKYSKYLSILAFLALINAIVSTVAASFYDSVSLAVYQSILTIVFWIAFYCMGFYIPEYNIDRIRKICLFFVYLFFGYSVWYFITEDSYMLPFVKGVLVDTDELASYQGIARNLLVVATFVIAFSKNNITNLVHTVALLIILFMLGARSELVAFFLIVMAYHLIRSIRIKSSFIVAASIFTIVAFAAVANYAELGDSRQFAIFNAAKDESWQQRNDREHFAIDTIQKNPILGDFGAYLNQGGVGSENVGGYAHNALSAYTEYGLLFFLAYIAVIFGTLFSSFFYYLKDLKNPYWAFCFLMCLQVAFMVVFSKNFAWSITYLSWGVYFGTLFYHARLKES
ncbi:O-antigen ligase family protein [Acinetobacter baumannii]